MTRLDAWAGPALIAAVIVLAGIARARAPGASHGRVAAEGGTLFLGKGLMNLGYFWIEQLSRLAVRSGLAASMLSWGSLLLGLGAGACVAAGYFGFAAWALALSGLADGLDGSVARMAGTASRGGSVLDSALDRYVEFFVYAGMLCAFRGSLLSQLLVLLALFGGFMVTYSTAKAEALHVVPPRGWMKRAERVAWLVLGLAAGSGAGIARLAPLPFVLSIVALIALFSNISAIVRLRAIGRTP